MKNILLCAAVLAIFGSCCKKAPDIVSKNFGFAAGQLQYAVHCADSVAAACPDSVKSAGDPRLFPRSINPDGTLFMVHARDWTSGFFPGSLWYMYEYTKDPVWLEAARRYTSYLEQVQYYTGTHDVGFMINDSYGNGYRITGDTSYRSVIVQTARSLVTRFNPAVGCIRSWSFHSQWQYPVIIDNMMNLELLFNATRISGDSTFYKVAVTHANTTMKNHFRDDCSSYHVIDYDTITGAVLNKHTHQGYAHHSSWARGQAWGLYGYTAMYRETGDKAYLDQAEKIAASIFSQKSMPADLIPYWDYNAPGIPGEPRDVSAATITASALYELSTMGTARSGQYLAWADTIIGNLTANYRAQTGANYGFLLLHSVGNKPGDSEIDTPLNYADYYFLEALLRKESLKK